MSKSEGPVSIRLDAETQQRLRRLAHETGGTMSSVVREAVTAYGAAWDSREATSSAPFARLQHLIGVVSSQTDRSERTGEQFRAVLNARGSARRPR
jgi:predicted transcriptional regulator